MERMSEEEREAARQTKEEELKVAAKKLTKLPTPNELKSMHPEDLMEMCDVLRTKAEMEINETIKIYTPAFEMLNTVLTDYITETGKDMDSQKSLNIKARKARDQAQYMLQECKYMPHGFY